MKTRHRLDHADFSTSLGLVPNRAIIDPDCRPTWPPAVTAWVDRYGDELRAGPGIVRLVEAEDEFRLLLEGHGVLTYHCSRFLDEELAAIRSDGLRPVSAHLIRRRIESAYRGGHLSRSQADELHRRNPFENFDQKATRVRSSLEARGQGVYLYLGRRGFEDSPFEYADWLGTWGGPTLFEPLGEQGDLRRVLRDLGRPSIVVAALEFQSDRFRAAIVDKFALMFCTIEGDEPWLGGEICYRANISGEDIIAVWQPGDPEYDRFAELPQN